MHRNPVWSENIQGMDWKHHSCFNFQIFFDYSKEEFVILDYCQEHEFGWFKEKDDAIEAIKMSIIVDRIIHNKN
jgi:hypothetical protein